VNVGVFARQYRRPARSTQSVSDESVAEKHSLTSKSVKVWGVDDAFQVAVEQVGVAT